MARRTSKAGRDQPRQRIWFLREWRVHRQLSQEALGDRVGMTQGMISQLEKGTTDFTGRHLRLLAEALNCSVRDLMFRRPGQEEDALSIYEDLPEREKAQAVEILKSLRRTAQ